MKIKCLNKKCIKSNKGKSYEWDYKGKNPFYATCPRCRTSVKINKKVGKKVKK